MPTHTPAQLAAIVELPPPRHRGHNIIDAFIPRRGAETLRNKKTNRPIPPNMRGDSAPNLCSLCDLDAFGLLPFDEFLGEFLRVSASLRLNLASTHA